MDNNEETSENKSGLQRISLKSLNCKIMNSMIVGIIIRTQNVRVFEDKNRAVWNFTLRETITDYINATFWGTDQYVLNMQKKFIVGDVVDLIKPKIVIRTIADITEQYRPAVTSPYALTLNEAYSSIIIHEGDNYPQYLPLLHYPTKPAASYLTLSDIQNNMESQGEYVNILVALQSVNARKILKRKKDGTNITKRDIIVTDQSYAGFKITLWDDEFIERSEQWVPNETILYLADVRMDWSNFDHNMTVVANSRTIITEDPIIPQAEKLRQFIQAQPKSSVLLHDYMNTFIPDVNKINTVMTVQRVLDTAIQEEMDTSETNVEVPDNIENNQFTALLYAVITDLDLDGFSDVVKTRCNRCNERIPKHLTQCTNENCPVGSGLESGNPEYQFEIPVNISDHTGTLDKCRLIGECAERMLGVTVQTFLNMSEEEKIGLKWKFLMERSAVRIVVVKRGIDWPIVTILECVLADPEEVAVKLPIN